jgi:MATE family multidrug resistance protein
MLAAPLFIGTAALREVRHGLGDSRSPMLSVLIGNVVNALLVAVFMYGFGWGVAGVAFATVLAQLVELGVMVWLQRARGFGLSEFSRQDLHTVLRLGLPLAIERVLDVGSFSVVVALFARMGDTDLAAHQVAHQVFLFAFLPLFAVGDATCVLVGQALGAGCLSALPPVQRAGSLVSYIYVAACSSGVVLFGPELAGAFTHDAAVIARATELQQIGALFLWLMPLYIVAQATLRGMGDVRVAAIITVIAAWICAPIFSAAFGIGLGLGAAGGWIGIGVEFGLASACFRWRQRRLLRSQAENALEVRRPSHPALA